MTDQSQTAAQESNIAAGDGCCHKTRIKDAPCPLGWKCPYIKEGASSDE